MIEKVRAAALTSALFCFAIVPVSGQEKAKQSSQNFANAAADIGIVVKDLVASAKFYTETLGMKEVTGFSVPAEKAKAIGLTDNQAATIRVFVLDDSSDGPKTKFKLMSFPDAPGKSQDQKFIHSTLGVSYLTLYVADMTSAVGRLENAKVELLGETPSDLGGNNFITVFRDPDGNFIELIGPMK